MLVGIYKHQFASQASELPNYQNVRHSENHAIRPKPYHTNFVVCKW